MQMAVGQAGSTTYRVTARGPGGQAEPAGIVAVDAAHHIAIVSAEPRFAELLEMAVENLNDTDTFMVRVAPPPDAEPLTLFKRAVARDAAEAGEAMITVLRREYGLELTPEP